MPELPEVETVRLGLLPALMGRRFTVVETRRAGLRVPFPKDFAKRLTGRRVLRLERRAKYLLAELDNGETLVMHLGMSGRMTVEHRAAPRPLGRYVHDMHVAAAASGKHDHLIMETDAPATVVFNDHRRFGLILLIDTGTLDQHALFKGLGVEPLSARLTPSYLRRRLTNKKSSIKDALLDQRVLAGLGNIYVSESLFRAKISPKRIAGKVTSEQTTRLTRAIKSVLQAAVKAGKQSLGHADPASGELGTFAHRFEVYGREGERCQGKGCKGTVKRIVQGGRATFYCPICQK
jgi:formamidopyrimidine-DNA glycosylase